ncbi:unnamed protein product [Closterium sp. Naga37s-1]|nr:unnamed protein product [Closterium sp. Naga37s-1]
MASPAASNVAHSLKAVVGFIGLGNMGACMAANVLRHNHPLAVFDRNEAAMALLVQQGAQPADSPADLASKADVIITMLPTPAIVLDVYTGPHGVLTASTTAPSTPSSSTTPPPSSSPSPSSHVSPSPSSPSSAPPSATHTIRPHLLIDASTVDPATCHALAAAVQACHVAPSALHSLQGPPLVVDAPVSGGVVGAKAGTLTFMVGGTAAAFAMAEPLLAAMGSRALHCGPSGSGSAAKLCNNLALAIQMASVSEALALGQRLGLSPALLSAIFNSSSAKCWSSEVYNPAPGVMQGVPSARHYQGGFSNALMSKDLGLAVAAAQAAGAPVPLGTNVMAMYADMVKAGAAADDFSSIYKHAYGASAAAAASPWPAGDGHRENSGANSAAAAAAAAPGGQADAAQAGASGARSAAGRRKVFSWEADAGADAPPRLHSSWATAPAPLPPSPKDSSILGVGRDWGRGAVRRGQGAAIPVAPSSGRQVAEVAHPRGAAAAHRGEGGGAGGGGDYVAGEKTGEVGKNHGGRSRVKFQGCGGSFLCVPCGSFSCRLVTSSSLALKRRLDPPPFPATHLSSPLSVPPPCPSSIPLIPPPLTSLPPSPHANTPATHTSTPLHTPTHPSPHGWQTAGLAGPLMFKRALDALTTVQGLTRKAIIAAVAALVVSAASKAVSAVSTELRNIVFTPVGQAVGRRVEYHFFAHILAMDSAFHLDRKTGALARIIERGKRSIIMIFRAVVFTFIPTAVELLLVCALLANHISLSFAGVVLLTFVVYVAWTVALTKASVSIRKEVNRLDGLATGKVVDVLLNHETVVQFNNQRLDLMHYDSLLRDYQRESVNLEKVSAALNGGQTTIISIGLAAVMAMAGLRVAVGRMTVGDLVLVNGLILQLSLPLQFLGFLYRDLRQSLVDMEAMFHMLSLESDLKDGDLELAPRAEGVAVDVRDISFSYMNGRQVLKGVSFSIAPGESVAIVGPSGSGKSTIVKLLLRLYDPSEGSISFDGTDARELKQESLRQAVAVVPQDTVLFNDSIRYNIAYGRPSASVAEVDRAAGQAKLLDAIRRMPDGFDTVVGERGLKLSGGEKQRVAIARAFLKNPRLLVCDEATSALDSATEANILRSLQQLAAGRSCLFVAHRLSTIKHCDKILVMEAGRVVEQGTHEQLLAAGGKYAAMWMLQDSERPALAPIPRPAAHATHTPAAAAASVNGDETVASFSGAVAAATVAAAATAASLTHQDSPNGSASGNSSHGSNGAVTSLMSGSGEAGVESGGDAELKEQLRAVAVSESEWRTDGRAPMELEEVGRRRDGDELNGDGGYMWKAHDGHSGADGEGGEMSGGGDGAVGVGAGGMHQDGEHVDGEGVVGGRSGGRVRGQRQTSLFLSEFARAGEYTGSEERVEDMVIAEDEIEREESEGESDVSGICVFQQRMLCHRRRDWNK